MKDLKKITLQVNIFIFYIKGMGHRPVGKRVLDLASPSNSRLSLESPE